MSSISNQTGVKTSSSGEEFPVAAIVCLAVGSYVAIVIFILILRYVLVKKGTCQSECCDCQETCTCNVCVRLSEACPCCCTPNPDGCLSKICGQRKRTNCIDILICNCCGCSEGCCESSCTCPSLTFCGDAKCQCQACFDCWDDEPDNNTCNCFCLAVKLRSPRRSGSLRRSSSVPGETYYNTHAQKGSHSPRLNPQETNRVYTLPNAGGPESHSVHKRSKSHSPHLSKSHSDTDHLNYSSSSSELNHSLRNARNGSRSHVLGRTSTRVSFDDNPVKDTLKGSTSSSHLSGSLTDTSAHDLSSSRGLLIKPNRDVACLEPSLKSKSRVRRSLRPGQKSQRFPNKILVSSESLTLSKSLRSSSGSENITFEKPSESETRILPQPTSLRFLPEIDNLKT